MAGTFARTMLHGCRGVRRDAHGRTFGVIVVVGSPSSSSWPPVPKRHRYGQSCYQSKHDAVYAILLRLLSGPFRPPGCPQPMRPVGATACRDPKLFDFGPLERIVAEPKGGPRKEKFGGRLSPVRNPSNVE